MVAITDLRRFGRTGWQWTVTMPGVTADALLTVDARTNEDGEGLFAYYDGGYSQSRGTSQFGLPSTEESARKALVKHYSQQR